MQYLIVIIGWLIGMYMVIVVRSWYVQRSKKYECGFWDAVKIYTKKDTGPLFLSIGVLLFGVFVLPDIISTAALMKDGKLPVDGIKAKAINEIVHNMRVYSVLFGITSQAIGLFTVSKAGKWINKVGQLTDEKIDNMKNDG